ncbi:ABC transporter domain containing protein [Trichostrongylus colubriformis]|uniref:ABC transporter domain containing protein n=2 Tax=Trichostrongylus colubriformis TaxID=6319 RepID=A0AAN8G2F5_TRICO
MFFIKVTVLLGHNGAGKSTTFSVICGITAPTAGNVYIYDLDIQKERSACRKKIGLCPQGNALFNRLTVNEHLWLIHGLKGGSGSYKTEGQQLLDKLKLDEKSDEVAASLSGGQKRKLCVSMALIGGSTLILLDEPTAGMDPQARRDVEALLESVKGDRTVLLTTHYMDEAELLGDRIAIMVAGRVYCCGTPQFLKERFGGGYIMTIVAAEKAKVGDVAETLADLAGKYVQGAERGPVHGKQFEITLPKEREKDFPQLFEHLEKSKDALQISSFGLSLNTLEQVFLKVAESADPAAGVLDLNERINRHKELIQALQVDRLEGSTLIFAQLCALITKRIMYYVRNWSQLIVQVLIPVGIALSCVYVSRGGLIKTVAEERTFSLETFGPSRIPVQMEANSPLVDAYLEVVSEAPPGSLIHKLGSSDSLDRWVHYLPKKMPPPGFGAIFAPSSITVLFSGRAFHSMPTAVNVFDNALLRAETGESDGMIRTHIRTYTGIGADEHDVVSAGQMGELLGISLLLALMLITSPIVIFLVEERVSKFSHQQSLTSVSLILFWAVSLFSDLVLYSLICACFVVVLVSFGIFQGYLEFLIVLLALYFWSCVIFIYLVSSIFSSPSRANVFLFIWQLAGAIGADMLIRSARMEAKGEQWVEDLRTPLLYAFPSFALLNATMTLGEFSTKLGPPNNPRSLELSLMLWEWNYIGGFFFLCSGGSSARSIFY